VRGVPYNAAWRGEEGSKVRDDVLPAATGIPGGRALLANLNAVGLDTPDKKKSQWIAQR
jgi:hypothetical protein